ncbi:MAG TPA: DNA integrity scanning protein DisA nucleotide-binding domain protein [Lacipirellulaceae bacterium]|nr:DNA integrity scanning protein DisA nucleotide-binding domain protein [Lacipirellulaceae bacterium]
MSPPAKTTAQLSAFIEVARRIAEVEEADALLVLLEAPLDWQELRRATESFQVVLAADRPAYLEGAAAAGFEVIQLSAIDSPVNEQLTRALLESVADDMLNPSACVVALYSGFEAGVIDSVSIVRLDKHLGRLTAHDLRQLETSVPLDTLKTAVDLAVAIGREGREGKPVGSLFVVGDHRTVLKHCRPLGFDPVKGYGTHERQLNDSKVREAIKEIAQLDGAFVVAADGTVVAACQHVSAPAGDLTLSKGLGARHWAAASISRATTAIAITVSESNGTVRVFQNGEVMLRIEPFRRAMKWRDFEYESPAGGQD